MIVSKSPDISFVVVNYQSEKRLETCLQSIEAQQVRIEVLVADNGSDFSLRRLLEARHPAVRWISMGENAGFSAASNRAVREATAERLLFLNPDTTLSADAAGKLVHVLDSPEFSSSVIGCAIFDDSGPVQLSCRRFPDWRTVLANRFSLLTQMLPANNWSRSYLMTDFDHLSYRRVDWVSGAAMAMRADTFRLLGGFDEQFFLYFEDVDYCRRARAQGVSVWYCPEVRLQHSIGGSSSKVPLFSLAYRHKSMWTYYRKYHRRFWLDPFVAAVVVGRLALSAAAHLLASGGPSVKPGVPEGNLAAE